jgi:hypothetical protein
MDKSFFHFEGRKIYFEQGMSIAAALLCYGIKDFRQTQVLRKSRGPFCILIIDGIGNQQGCMRLAEQGIIVKRENSYPL